MTKPQGKVLPKSVPPILRDIPKKGAAIDDKFINERLEAAFDYYGIDQSDESRCERLSFALMAHVFPGFSSPDQRQYGGRPSASNSTDQKIALALHIEGLERTAASLGRDNLTRNDVIRHHKANLLRAFPFLAPDSSVKAIANHARNGRKALDAREVWKATLWLARRAGLRSLLQTAPALEEGGPPSSRRRAEGD